MSNSLAKNTGATTQTRAEINFREENPIVHNLNMHIGQMFSGKPEHALPIGLKKSRVLLLGKTTDGKTWIISRQKPSITKPACWEDVNIFDVSKIRSATKMTICKRMNCNCLHTLITTFNSTVSIKPLYTKEKMLAGLSLS